MIDLENRILMAVPKKGRINETTMKYLNLIGLSFHKRDRFDIALCSLTPIALIFLPAKDIPLYVSHGRVSFGITGQDMVSEYQADVDEVLALGFGKCRLCIAAPKALKYTPKDLIGKNIATSFPNLTRQYFEQKLKTTQIGIKEISGSVEIAPTLGSADAIVDLVETGSTLVEAELEIVDTIMKTESVLISRKKLEKQELEWLNKIKTRLEGVINAEKFLILDYNIKRSSLKQAEKITPGMKSPTITPLENKDWVAVRSVINRGEMFNIIEKLKSIGAEDILVSRMEYLEK